MLFVENEKDAGNFFCLVGANWAANLLIFRLVYSCVTLNNKKYLSTHPALSKEVSIQLFELFIYERGTS